MAPKERTPLNKRSILIYILTIVMLIVAVQWLTQEPFAHHIYRQWEETFSQMHHAELQLHYDNSSSLFEDTTPIPAESFPTGSGDFQLMMEIFQSIRVRPMLPKGNFNPVSGQSYRIQFCAEDGSTLYRFIIWDQDHIQMEITDGESSFWKYYKVEEPGRMRELWFIALRHWKGNDIPKPVDTGVDTVHLSTREGVVTLNAPRTEGATPLTIDQLEQARAAFQLHSSENETILNDIEPFFSCYYAEPREINPESFILSAPGGQLLTAADEAEFLALLPLSPYAEEVESFDQLPEPVYRFRREALSALLQKYCHISLEDLSAWEGGPLHSLENILYLEEYDAFYAFGNEVSPRYFDCLSGEKLEDSFRLWTVSQGDAGTWDVLTVVQQDGEYLLHSLLAEPSGKPSRKK